jgi:hypothetical protein
MSAWMADGSINSEICSWSLKQSVSTTMEKAISQPSVDAPFV